MGKVIAEGRCPVCGHAAQIRENKKGRPYIYCPTPAEGGCGTGTTARYEKGAALMIERYSVKTRASPEKKPSPAPDTPEPPAPAPAKPAPAPKKKPWWDIEL